MPKDLFDGVMIEIRRPIYGKSMRDMFDLAHSFIFGSTAAPTSYTFASTWLRNHHKLHGRVNVSKQIVTGSYSTQIFPGLSASFQASVSRKSCIFFFFFFFFDFLFFLRRVKKEQAQVPVLHEKDLITMHR